MQLKTLKPLYKKHKELALFHRYIHTKHIVPLLQKLKSNASISIIGNSVCDENIYAITIGSGKKKVFMWSQMHGNESTTTKAIFDLLQLLTHENDISKSILDSCTIKIIPILNPDGAKKYTRLNANEVDLNRDAQNLSQPESIVLYECFKAFQPDFCFNLHGQRTIFGAGENNKPATVSFLAPAQDEKCTITNNRKRAMELISVMNTVLQEQIPNQIGIYDDAFNINCVGDTFQSENVPTILFEAGHFKEDYEREVVREHIFQSLVASLCYISNGAVTGDKYSDYLDIPENKKTFFDIIIRNAKVEGKKGCVDIVIQYEEKLKDDIIVFSPKVEKFTKVNQFFAHKEIDANGGSVFTEEKKSIFVGYENDLVVINNEKLSLELVKS